MSYFRPARATELSTIEYLEISFNADWTGVSVIKSFTNAYKTALPVVCVRLSSDDPERKEVGSSALRHDYTITIDIFATSDGQRLDLADYILDKLKDFWTYYDFSQTSGAPDTLTKVANGQIHVTRFIDSYKVDFGEEGVDVTDRFRHFIQVAVRKE